MTAAPSCVCHLLSQGCRQGRDCPFREIEAANDVALDPLTEFPTPKGKRMNYRPTSSALTGRAPRTMERAFGCSMHDPVHPMPDAGSPAVLDVFGRALNAFGRLLARLFGR